MIKNIFSHKRITIGVFFLVLIAVAALCAECIAPYDYARDNRMRPFVPPTRIHIIDAEGVWHMQPFVYAYTQTVDSDHGVTYQEDTAQRYPINVFVKSEPYRVWNVIPCTYRLFGTDSPAEVHVLGSDWRGRDIFSRVLVGARISLSIACVGVILSVALGAIVGSCAGYFGGCVDFLCMRLVEIVMMVPVFFLLLAIRSALPLAIDSLKAYVLVVGVLSVVGWAAFARIIRGLVLSIKTHDYILAARVMGMGPVHIIRKHILPHTSSYIIIVIATSVPAFIIAESALSFLGLGIREPYVSWGMLLMDTMSFTRLASYPWLLLPGMCIFIVVFLCNMIGDGLRDLWDPHRETVQ